MEVQIIRNEPENLKPQDFWLFKHELKRSFAAPFIATKKGLVVNANIEFTEKLKEDTLISKQANFFKCSFFGLGKKIIRLRFHVIVKKKAVITDGWSFGYFHWLMDCLPRLLLLRSSGANFPLILPQGLEQYSYVKESLQMLGESNYRFLKKHNWYFVRSLCFPSHLAPTGNYNERMMVKLRESFLQGINEEPVLKVYISRNKSSRRKIANEEVILPVLRNAGFSKVFCEDLSFAEQVKLFSKAKYLVSNHGAGLSNMLFMHPHTKVLELRREDDGHSNCYFSLASALGINYYYQNCTTTYASHDIHNADLAADAGLLLKNLNLMMEDV